MAVFARWDRLTIDIPPLQNTGREKLCGSARLGAEERDTELGIISTGDFERAELSR